ncbi:hypothetical protein MTO96_021241 [Rhipicephalus appendiculatus]
MGRRVGVGRTDPLIHETRERSTRFREPPSESRVGALGPSTHACVQSHRRLAGSPRQQKRSLSAHHQRYAAAKLATGIQFIEATDSDGDQQQLMWTLLFKWAEWQLPRYRRHLRARRQRAEARTSVLHAPDLSIHRANDTTSAALTKSRVQGFSRSDFHQLAPSCVPLGAQMQKGCQWSPFAVSDVRLAVAQQECFRIRGVGDAQVWNGDAFSVVALPDQVIRQLFEHLLLAEGSGPPNQWPNRAYVCFYRLRLSSRAGLCWSIMDVMEVAQPLVVKSPDFCFSSEAPRGWWQKETALFLGCHYGVQPFSIFRDLSNVGLETTLVKAAAAARLHNDGEAAQ